MINNVAELKKQSRVRYYASLFGKSVIAHNSEEYAVIKDVARYLIEEGFGVIHGGYAGGAMSAISESANEVIRAKELSPYMHIAVPQADYDIAWERVEGAMFSNTADDIFDRLRMITTSDMAVVLPIGGIGTQLELTTVFHENQIKEHLKRRIQPLVFFCTPGGTNWREIMDHLLKSLDLKEQSGGSEWMHFVDSMEEFKEVIQKIKLSL